MSVILWNLEIPKIKLQIYKTKMSGLIGDLLLVLHGHRNSLPRLLVFKTVSNNLVLKLYVKFSLY